jgi:mono/diheme cytochrome c family protein
MRIAILIISCFVAFVVTAAAMQDSSVWDGVYTPAQADRGAVLYSKSCAGCHGADLMGGETAPALTGGQFRTNWDGFTVGDLFERTRVSMPADGPGTLTRQEYADILAFVFLRGEFPPGMRELSSRTEILRQIAFKATKP